MPEPGRRRPVTALLCAVVALSLPGLAGAGAFSSTGARGLALSGLLSACTLAGLALAGAAWSCRSPRVVLGWGTGRADVGLPARASLIGGALGLSMALDVALTWLGLWHGSALEWLDRSIHGASPAELALLLLGLALGPGLAEELLFRGAVLGAITRRAGVATGVVVSALLFGALHLDVAQSAATALIGVYLACVTIATGSIRTAVIAHVANNAAAVLDAAWIEPDRGAGLPDLLMLGLGACLALAALRTLAQTLPRGVDRAEASRHDGQPDERPA